MPLCFFKNTKDKHISISYQNIPEKKIFLTVQGIMTLTLNIETSNFKKNICLKHQNLYFIFWDQFDKMNHGSFQGRTTSTSSELKTC